MSGYREFRFYSPDLDANAVRLSLADDQGREYYAIVPVAAVGKSWREQREATLSAIDDAIAEGQSPGEVKVCP